MILQLHYRHISSHKKDCTAKIWILISKFPLVLVDYEVSFNIHSYKWNKKNWKGSAWKYWLPLASKALPYFLKGMKFFRKNKTEIVRNFGNSWKWQMAICEEKGEFGLNKTFQKTLINWIESTLMRYGPKKNNFAKYTFPIPVHFMSNIKGFW